MSNHRIRDRFRFRGDRLRKERKQTLVSDVEKHRDADVFDEDELIAVCKDGVPQEEDVFDVKLSSKHETNPTS